MVEKLLICCEGNSVNKKIITLKLFLNEILSFKPKNLTSGNLTSKIL